jgi:CDP-glycerol glycerophosphotransferase (TagB/SpsB family)
MDEFLKRLKFVHRKDLIAIFPMIASFIVSLFVRHRHRNVWLICERKAEARDNGYWFFKYICENHPEIEAVYAISNDSVDRPKVAKIGKVIAFSSFKHWVYYWIAQKNISSQKEGKPNAAVCFILEVYLGLRRNRAFIRHGISKDDQKWVYYKITKMNLFTTTVKREYDFVCERFGYPRDNVKLVGLCRYDNLITPHNIKRQIVVMPTMREWLKEISADTLKYEHTKNFMQSEYFITWTSLLSSKTLHNMLEEYNIDLLFFPHASMQKYVNDFSSDSKHIIIADSKKYDVQQLLMESAVLITDYSSVYFDFAFMKKPIIYYHFDYDKYRKGQYQEGYFSYTNDGFGDVVTTEADLLEVLSNILAANLVMPSKYINRVDNFFTFRDNKNCERAYIAIKAMK